MSNKFAPNFFGRTIREARNVPRWHGTSYYKQLKVAEQTYRTPEATPEQKAWFAAVNNRTAAEQLEISRRNSYRFSAW